MTKQATYEEYAQWVKYVGGEPGRTEYMGLTFSEKESIKNEVIKASKRDKKPV